MKFLSIAFAMVVDTQYIEDEIKMRVFGLHNFPDIPLGHFTVKQRPMMASFDCFEVVLTGQATHAAIPHLGNDAIVAAAQLINALQTIVSRTVDPTVVSITQIYAVKTLPLCC